MAEWFSTINPWLSPVAFVLSIWFLDRYEISLPRGDRLGVSGSLLCAALVLLGLPAAAVVSFTATLISMLGERSRTTVGALLRAGTIRLASLGAAGALLLLDPRQNLTAPDVWTSAIGIVGYLLVNLTVTQVVAAARTSRGFARLWLGNVRMQAPLLAAQASAAALVVVIYPAMGVWSLIPAVALLLLIRQSYALLLEVRETYRTTIEVLAEIAEAEDSRRLGHAERTAAAARRIASRLGLTAGEVERVSYSALLHDLDAISGAEAGSVDAGNSARVIESVEFFAEVVPVIRICDGTPLPGDLTERNMLAAMIVAVSSDADCESVGDVRTAHGFSSVARVSDAIPPALKAQVVAAAIESGYATPAVPR